MRVGALSAAGLALLAGPTALAFFSGGYFDEPRAWAGLSAWILVVIAVLAEPQGVPRRPVSWLAIGALLALAGWTLLSITWAPIAGSAYHAGQLVVLYAGALLAGAMLLRSRPAQRAVEPALAAGALIVVGYGISDRLLPGLLHFHRSLTAQGRLEQPLTYWNAMGELAAMGLVLCVRIAGDATRQRWVRAIAGAACAPLGMGLYLTFSRGALFACAAGLLALIVLAPRREQLHSLLLAIVAGGLTSAAAAPFSGLTALAGSQGTRQGEGAIALALLALIMIAAGLSQWRLASRERAAHPLLPRRAPLIAVVAICAGLAVAIVAGAKEQSSRPLSPGASRYETLESNRYEYWGVALRAFGDQPLRGVGAGGWAVYWLRYRSINDFAQDAHSLVLQTLAELGAVGGALLLLFLAAVAVAARVAHGRAPGPAAGPIAALVVYVAHAPLDWDWQMPAVTLVALVLAGAAFALGETSRESYSASAMRGASRLKTQTELTHTSA